MRSQGASGGHDVEGQKTVTQSDGRKSTEDGAHSTSIQTQMDTVSSEAAVQVVRRSKGRSSNREVFETWILPLHRLSFSWGKKRRQPKLPAEEEVEEVEAEEVHDYVNVFDRKRPKTKTEDVDVTPDYVNVATATNESDDVKSYENCEFVSKDLRIRPQDLKSSRIKTYLLPILDNSAKALARSVPAMSLMYIRETPSADNCSDDEGSLDSSYVDMSSKQMAEKLQRPKLRPVLSTSAPEIAIYENERLPSGKTRPPISTKDKAIFR